MSFINVQGEVERRKDPVPWQTTRSFRYQPYFEKDYLFAPAAVRRLSRENTSGMSIISKAATAQWLINAKLALELNELGIHALIGTACSCGFGINVERIKVDKPVTRADRERILFSLPGHIDTKTLRWAGLDLTKGVLSWPERQFWIQPAGKLIRTRRICWEKGDLGPVWTDKQSAQLAKWRDQAATKAAQSAKTTEN